MADTLTLKEVELDYEADEGITPPPPPSPHLELLGRSCNFNCLDFNRKSMLLIFQFQKWKINFVIEV